MKTHRIIVAVIALMIPALVQTFGIEELKLQIRCPDVVLSWPSVEGETYIVQYRGTLTTNTPWTTLTNSLPAESGTNVTLFVHSNRLDCPVGQVFGMLRASGGDNEPSALVASSLSMEARLQLRAEREVIRLLELEEKCKLEGREPYVWELSNQPPLPLTPEEVRARILSAKANRAAGVTVTTAETANLDGASGASGGNGPEPEGAGGGVTSESGCGFYRVVRNNVHLVGVTNGMAVIGTITIPVEVGYDDGYLASVSLTEGGAAISPNMVRTAPFDGLPKFDLDTTQLSNGVHSIVGHASWALTNQPLPYFDADSVAVEIVVSNLISFPDWMPTFGQDYDACLFTAQSAILNVDWTMDVYDSQSTYIGTVGSTTTDGTFGFAWNLIGPGNVRHDDDFFYAVVTVAPTGQGSGGGSASTPITVKNKDRWTNRGEWVVANQQAWSEDNGYVGGNNLDAMTDGFAIAAETVGITVRPTHPSQEAFRIHFVGAGASQGDADWATFRGALYHTNSRNVFYSGHGGTDGIGYNPANTNRFISISELTNVFHTVPAGQTNRHGFRFTFLDGCKTATSSKMAEAFGIVPKVNVAVDYYNASGERPSAFVGWNVAPAAGYANHVVNTDHWKFIQSFLYRWSTGEGVRSALDNAPGGPFPNGINPNRLTVYGYVGLGYQQGNH